MKVQIETTKRIIQQDVGGKSMENYMADMLVEIELELKQLEFNAQQEAKQEIESE